MISFVIVINGPVAIAGSILTFSNSNGTKVPKIAANMITAKSESDTATDIIMDCSTPVIKKK